MKISILPAAILLIGLSGCNDKAELESLKSAVAQAQKLAAEARTLALDNQRNLQTTTATANTAMQAAEQATQLGQAANTKIDRAFKRSMHK